MCNWRRHCVLESKMIFDRGAGIDIREIARGIMIGCVMVEWNEEARQNKKCHVVFAKEFHDVIIPRRVRFPTPDPLII